MNKEYFNSLDERMKRLDKSLSNFENEIDKRLENLAEVTLQPLKVVSVDGKFTNRSVGSCKNGV